MKKSSKQDHLYNVLMSQYMPPEDVNEGKEEVVHEYTNDEVYKNYIEDLDPDVVKAVLGEAAMEDGSNYRLVTSSDGMSIVYDNKDGTEEVHYLEPDPIEVTSREPDTTMEYTTNLVKIDYRSVIEKILIAAIMVVIVGIIYLLTWRL